MKRSWILVIGFALFLILMGMVPTALPYFLKPVDRDYTWMEGWSDDYIGYVSYVKEGMYGRNTFSIRSLPKAGQKATSAHLIYIAIGKIGGLLGLSAPVAYHAGRMVISFFLITMLYIFFRNILKNDWHALLSTIFASIGAEPGWFQKIDTLWVYRPLGAFDFGTGSVLRMITRPHYDLGGFLFLAILTLLLFVKSNIRLRVILLSISSIVMGTVHPALAFILFSTLGLTTLSKILLAKKIQWSLLPFFVTLMSLAFGLALSYWSIHQYPFTAILSFESYVVGQSLPISRILMDIVAFGPMLWLGLPGLVFTFVREKHSRAYTMVLLFWVIVQLSLFFFFYPLLHTERVRYIQSMYYVPLVYGTAKLFAFVLKKKSAWTVAMLLLVVLSLPSYINDFTKRLYAQNTDFKSFSPFIFPPNHAMDAYRFLNDNTPKESNVLAGYEAANNILLYSHNYVIGNPQGWPAENGAAMQREAGDFFAGKKSYDQIRQYIEIHSIDFIYAGYQEWRSNVLEMYPTLFTPIYTNPEVTIYQVTK